MTQLDMHDIQRTIVRGYRLPYACYFFLNIRQNAKGTSAEHVAESNVKARALVMAIGEKVTLAMEHWENKIPADGATTNIAFTYSGLAALGVPEGTLHEMPVEFKQGMKKRAALLGDTGPSDPEHWDEVWRKGNVDMWVSINGISEDAVENRGQWLQDLIDSTDGCVEVVYKQPANALKIDGEFTNKEHFGFSDGIGNPVYDGSGAPNIPGRGKLVDGKWQPLATGEFILGYPDEAGEIPPAPLPHVFARNGTFMVYRKLHQRVKSFKNYLKEQGELYPGGPDLLAAKWAGRWDNGAPLELYPDNKPDLSALSKEELANFNNFRYLPDDADGNRCPLGAHIRRTNPRDAMGFDGKLANRRRVIRRGLPYGDYMPPGSETDDKEHGIIFMTLNASIIRQFEFVQQQWIEYGNDFQLGNDKDVLIGNNNGTGKAVIQGNPPFICAKLPHFVECRGGDYFFIPSMTALRLIANQAVNPL